MTGSNHRSYETIVLADLEAFASKALARLTEVFDRAPVAGRYRERLLALVLAQGGALHFLDRQTGLKDIDIWALFKGGLDKPFPVRARWTADFGVSKFGKHPDDFSFVGRRIDIMGRAVDTGPDDDLITPVSRWLNGHSKSAFELRKKAVVAIYPTNIVGQRIL